MLLTVSNGLKTAAFAALLGTGLAAAGTTSASADTFRTHCFGGVCYQQRCDDFGADCIDIGYSAPAVTPWYGYGAYPYPTYGPTYGVSGSRYICDADGDNCRWVPAYDYHEEDFDAD